MTNVIEEILNDQAGNLSCNLQEAGYANLKNTFSGPRSNGDDDDDEELIPVEDDDDEEKDEEYEDEKQEMKVLMTKMSLIS